MDDDLETIITFASKESNESDSYEKNVISSIDENDVDRKEIINWLNELAKEERRTRNESFN